MLKLQLIEVADPSVEVHRAFVLVGELVTE